MQQGEMITFRYKGLLVVGMYERIEDETLWTRFSIKKQTKGWAPGRNVGYYLSDIDDIKKTQYESYKQELDSTFEQVGLCFDGDNMIEIPNYAIGDYIVFKDRLTNLFCTGIVEQIDSEGVFVYCSLCCSTNHLLTKSTFVKFTDMHKTDSADLNEALNQALLSQKSLVFDKEKKVLRKWRATQDEPFYYISPDGDVRIKKENGDGFCNKCYEYGNYYKFSELAIIVANNIQRYL